MLVVVAAAVPAAEAAGRPKRLYVALGDSLAFGIGASDPATKGYVGQLAQALQGPARWHVDRVRNVSVPVNETSASILGTQLSDALEAIDERATDTRLVTLGLGGNDVSFGGPCTVPASRACGFVSHFETLLRRLSRALRLDPGREALVVLTRARAHHGGLLG